MDLLGEALRQAAALFAGGDRRSGRSSGCRCHVGHGDRYRPGLGIPRGALLALARFPGRGLVVSAVNTGMGLPPVVVGLFVSLLLWRSGLFGAWEILYTPTAIVIAQAVIAAPIVTGITWPRCSTSGGVPPAARRLAPRGLQMVWVVLREAACPCWPPSWRASAG